MLEAALSTITANAAPLEPGALIQAQMLAELCGLQQDTLAFCKFISEIRRALFGRGIYLSSETLQQTGAYQILHPRDHHWIAKLALACCQLDPQDAKNLLENPRLDGLDLQDAHVLLVNTSVDGLSQLEKTRHQESLTELSVRLSKMPPPSNSLSSTLLIQPPNGSAT